jgi:hypothetical protein
MHLKEECSSVSFSKVINLILLRNKIISITLLIQNDDSGDVRARGGRKRKTNSVKYTKVPKAMASNGNSLQYYGSGETRRRRKRDGVSDGTVDTIYSTT